MTTGAQVVARVLARRGVSRVFGVPGAENLELLDALAGEGINFTLATSEGAAGFMADGYGRASGTTGVCLAIPGPGLTNMATALAEAACDSAPLLVLAPALEDDGRVGRLHGVDQLAVIKLLVRGVVELTEGSTLGLDLERALDLCGEGEPGPVVATISRALQRGKALLPSLPPEARPVVDGEQQRQVEGVADRLRGARRPGIYVGMGAMGAADQVRQLAEALAAPVSTTISGKGVLPEDHPLACGYGFGPTGAQAAREIFKGRDLVLALGCKFSEMSAGPGWSMEVPGELIHVDAAPGVLGKNYPAARTLCMDAGLFLDALLRRVEARARDPKLEQQIRCLRHGATPRPGGSKDDGGVDPVLALRKIRACFPRETVFVTDCGNHQLHAVLHLPALAPRTFITPADYQAMGFGLPAAVGAALVQPRRAVVALVGDGGFQMSGFELLTAAREGLDLTVVVFNDGALGLIRSLQQRVHGRETGVSLRNPGFEDLARALGARYLEIGHADQLDHLPNGKGVTLVNLKVRYDRWPAYLEGAARAAWRNKPLSEKVMLVLRRVKRAVK